MVTASWRAVGGAEDADVIEEGVFHLVAQGEGVFGAVLAAAEIGQALGLGGHGVFHQGEGEDQGLFLGKSGDPLSHRHAGDDGFGQGVAAQAVEAVEVPAGGFAGGKEGLQAVNLAMFIGAHPAHGVVLGGPDRDEGFHAVDAQEILANGVDFPEVGADVLGAQVADVQPEVGAVGAVHPEALADVVQHPAADHVPGGDFLFHRLIIGHEAVEIFVEEDAAVAPAAFGHQDIGGNDAGGMELHRLHVAQGHEAGVLGDGHAGAFIDDGVGGGAVDAAVAAGGDDRGLGQVGANLAGAQIHGHGAETGLAVVDQADGLAAIMDRDPEFHHHGIHGVLEDVAGAVGGEAGAPLGGAAELALGDEAGLFLEVFDLSAVGQSSFAGDHPGPGDAPMGKLAHGHGGQFAEKPGHFLVAAPVGALDRIFKVDVGIVAVALGHVAEGRLHAPLGGGAVGAAGRDQAQDGDLVALHGGFDGHTFAGQAGPDDQDVRYMCVGPVHDRPLGMLRK